MAPDSKTTPLGDAWREAERRTHRARIAFHGALESGTEVSTRDAAARELCAALDSERIALEVAIRWPRN